MNNFFVIIKNFFEVKSKPTHTEDDFLDEDIFAILSLMIEASKIDDNIEVDLQESDCRIDTYRSSGAGGQHVNTTDSAVRITHTPTNIVVQCQSQRSQHKNKSTALSMLRARLYELELQKKEEKAQEILDTKSEIGWGHQIRSYVLQPYQMVKDLRTNVEDGNTQAVLDGRIDKFLTSALSRKIS